MSGAVVSVIIGVLGTLATAYFCTAAIHALMTKAKNRRKQQEEDKRGATQEALRCIITWPWLFMSGYQDGMLNHWRQQCVGVDNPFRTNEQFLQYLGQELANNSHLAKQTIDLALGDATSPAEWRGQRFVVHEGEWTWTGPVPRERGHRRVRNTIEVSGATSSTEAASRAMADVGRAAAQARTSVDDVVRSAIRNLSPAGVRAALEFGRAPGGLVLPGELIVPLIRTDSSSGVRERVDDHVNADSFNFPRDAELGSITLIEGETWMCTAPNNWERLATFTDEARESEERMDRQNPQGPVFERQRFPRRRQRNPE